MDNNIYRNIARVQWDGGEGAVEITPVPLHEYYQYYLGQQQAQQQVQQQMGVIGGFQDIFPVGGITMGQPEPDITPLPIREQAQYINPLEYIYYNNLNRQQARQQAAAERTRRHHEAQHAAYERAKQLLLSMVTEKQAEEYNRTGRLFVNGSDGGRWLFIPGGGMPSVASYTTPRNGTMYCIGVYAYMPEPDKMLAMKLMLENDEPRFKIIARRLGYASYHLNDHEWRQWDNPDSWLKAMLGACGFQ